MKQTVLLIDDDEAMRQSTEQALELAGFHVQSFPGAEQALGFAGPGFNGAVISDIRMPGMDGMSLLERLAEADRDLPVILITGHAEVSLAVEAMRRGAYDFIEKPFSTQALDRPPAPRPRSSRACDREPPPARRRRAARRS